MRAIFASRKLTVLLFHGNITFGYFHCLKPVLSLHALARTPKGFGKQGNTIFYFKGTRNRNFDNKKIREQWNFLIGNKREIENFQGIKENDLLRPLPVIIWWCLTPRKISYGRRKSEILFLAIRKSGYIHSLSNTWTRFELMISAISVLWSINWELVMLWVLNIPVDGKDTSEYHVNCKNSHEGRRNSRNNELRNMCMSFF